MKKDYMEIILEDMRGKLELVLEAHDALRQQISDTRQELTEGIDLNSFRIDGLNRKVDDVESRLSKKIESLDSKIDRVDANLGKKIDAVAADLAAHRADTESHGKGYRVSEE